MNSDQGCGWAAICLRDDQTPIGFAGIAPVNYFKAAFVPGDEIGWRLLPEFWGKVTPATQRANFQRMPLMTWA